MSFSATRLTCFALLSAMEEDMRAAIEAAAGHMEINELMSPDLAELAQGRRSKDGLGVASKVAGLLPYLDFADSYEILRRHAALVPTELSEPLSGIGPQVQRVIKIRNRVAPYPSDGDRRLLATARLGEHPGNSARRTLAGVS
jgi:LuxR family glucitol operon transcriptional activator